MTVTGLLTGPSAASGVPHVTGVRTSGGEALAADLVIDAMGRRSALPDWLEGIGGRRPIEQAEDSGFIYYSRYFRSATGSPAQFRAGLLTHFDSFSILTLPGDAHTWSVTVYVAAGDQALKQVRDLQHWTALVAACPLHAHLLDATPITDILSLGGVLDRYRRLSVDATPVATGIAAVGDSWACTNPSLGRGLAMGLIHAAGTREVARQHLGDPLALATAHDEMTEARVTPWYRHTIELDRARVAGIDAVIEGRALPEPDRSGRTRPRRVPDRHPVRRGRVPSVQRDQRRCSRCPREVMSRPGLVDSIWRLRVGASSWRLRVRHAPSCSA